MSAREGNRNAKVDVDTGTLSGVAGELRLIDQLHHFLAVCIGDRVFRLNKAAAAMLELRDPNAAIGLPFFSFAHPDYVGLAEIGLDAIADEGTKLSIKLMREGGGPLDVEMWVSRLNDAVDKGLYLVEAHDITSHLRAAQALRVRELRLQGIINTVADGVITIDEHGIIQTFNPAAESIFGLGRTDVVGKGIRSLIKLQEGEDADALSDGEWTKLLGDVDNVTGVRCDGAAIPLELAVRELYQDNQLSFTGIVRDVSARREAERRIFHMAHHDALTGLPNRHLFGDRLDEAFKRAQRAGVRLGVLFIDLDGFKPINDSYGHAVGDTVLQEVAARLTHAVRASDTVARVGGDEFTVLLEGLRGRDEANEICCKIKHALGLPIRLPDGRQITSGASVGIGVYPDDARDAVALIGFADRAMYGDKHAAAR